MKCVYFCLASKEVSSTWKRIASSNNINNIYYTLRTNMAEKKKSNNVPDKVLQSKVTFFLESATPQNAMIVNKKTYTEMVYIDCIEFF